MPTRRPHTTDLITRHAEEVAEAFRSWLLESDCMEERFQHLVADIENRHDRHLDDEAVEALRQRAHRVIGHKIRLVLRTGDWREL